MNNKKILLVEDDTALASVYRSRLELEGFTVDEVNNGEEALSKAVEFKPDLILLDAMMPKISGFDVLDILRNTPETSNVRVVMLTALSQAKDKERAQSLGADDYLVKSQVVIGDVVDRIKHHLGVGEDSSQESSTQFDNIAPKSDSNNENASKDDDATHVAM
jgi:DNA-binding response OmpR family regulator